MLLDAMMLGSLLSGKESPPFWQQSSSADRYPKRNTRYMGLDAGRVWIDASFECQKMATKRLARAGVFSVVRTKKPAGKGGFL